jgi:hypothetical protein
MHPAQAALLGDEVRLQMLFAIGVPAFFDQTAVVVDPGIEFTFVGTNDSTINIDVKNDSFDIIFDFNALGSVGFDSTFILSDLDWVDTPGIITGVTLTSGEASLVSGISFTDNSITVDILDYTIPPQNDFEQFSFAIETQHESVPEPGTILGLLTLAGLGIGSRFKRNVG